MPQPVRRREDDSLLGRFGFHAGFPETGQVRSPDEILGLCLALVGVLMAVYRSKNCALSARTLML